MAIDAVIRGDDLLSAARPGKYWIYRAMGWHQASVWARAAGHRRGREAARENDAGGEPDCSISARPGVARGRGGLGGVAQRADRKVAGDERGGDDWTVRSGEVVTGKGGVG